MNLIERVISLFKNNKNTKKSMETSIKVIYLIGSRSHTKEFKRYALFGKWMCLNWRKIRIVNITVEGDY